jgi:hypothetical protein
VRKLALLASVVAAAIAVAGCGQSSSEQASGVVLQPDAGKGPVSRPSVPATRECGSASRGTADSTPPVPLLRARRVEEGFEVEWELLARPGGCKPVAIAIFAASVDRQENKGLAIGADVGGRIPVADDGGTVRLREPPLDLPPYEVLGASYTAEGRTSDVTRVPVPDDSDYCRRKRPADECFREAEAKYMRCIRGQEPEAACPSWVWNTRPPIEVRPTRGISTAELERSFALMARRGDTGSYALVSVRCPSTTSCIADWRGSWGYTEMRFLVSGDRYRAGCWIAERRAVLADSGPLDADGHTMSDLMTDRRSGCVQ